MYNGQYKVTQIQVINSWGIGGDDTLAIIEHNDVPAHYMDMSIAEARDFANKLNEAANNAEKTINEYMDYQLGNDILEYCLNTFVKKEHYTMLF